MASRRIGKSNAACAPNGRELIMTCTDSPFRRRKWPSRRSLTNYLLLRSGFPALIIKSSDKSNYLAALRLADVEQLGFHPNTLVDNLEWSLELGLRAAKGESLEEPTDLEKEIAIFMNNRRIEMNINKRSPEVMEEL